MLRWIPRSPQHLQVLTSGQLHNRLHALGRIKTNVPFFKICLAPFVIQPRDVPNYTDKLDKYKYPAQFQVQDNHILVTEREGDARIKCLKNKAIFV